MSSAQDLTDVVLDGRYRLIRLMGQGGMGQVYEGFHETLDRKIAVKVLLPRYAHEPKFRERFLREAKAASKVRHPNVVQILDFGDTPNGSVYFSMEFLEGCDLHVLLGQEGPLSWPRARLLLLQMTSALGAAHERKIIHRDIKPANFFVTETRGHELVKVLDFGIAKIAAEPGSEGDSQAQSLTGTGEVFGTAKYMAPEQAFGASNDPRVDVYSLGIVAYEMLTGRVPFAGSSVFEIITRHVNDVPRPPREWVPEISEAVQAAILRAIAKRPEDRFASMDELGQVLADIGGGASMADSLPLAHSRPPPSTAIRPVTVPTVPAVPTAPAREIAGVLAVSSLDLAAAPVLQSRRRASSDMVTAAGKRAQERGPVTSVVPARIPAPSPMVARPDDVPSVIYGGGPATTPGLGVSNVGTSTGPLDSRTSSSQLAGTESFPSMTGSRDPTSRPRVMIGFFATLILGGGVMGAIALFPGEEPSTSSAALAPVVTVQAKLDGTPQAIVEPAAAQMPTEPSVSNEVPAAVEPEPTVESLPEPEPEPPAESKPVTKPVTKPTGSSRGSSKPPTPPSDGQLRTKLAKSLRKKCRAFGSGSTVTVEVVVGSDGRVLSKKASGTSGELLKCLVDEVAKAVFSAGTTRKVSIPVQL